MSYFLQKGDKLMNKRTKATLVSFLSVAVLLGLAAPTADASTESTHSVNATVSVNKHAKKSHKRLHRVKKHARKAKKSKKSRKHVRKSRRHAKKSKKRIKHVKKHSKRVAKKTKAALKAKTFKTSRVRKMLRGNFPIFTSTALKSQAGNTTDYKDGYIESDRTAKIGGKTYYHITVDGRSMGWVSSDAMDKNVMSVAPNVDMAAKVTAVRHYGPKTYTTHMAAFSQDTRDAINYATDGTGTYIPWNNKNIHVSVNNTNKSSVSNAKPGTYRVNYSYGNAHASTNFVVRPASQDSTSANIDANANGGKGKSVYKHSFIFHKTWAVPTGHSSNWVASRHFHNETHDTVVPSKKGTHVTWRTRLFQPTFLSVSHDNKGKDPNAVLPLHPEGMAVGNGWAYSTYLTNRAGDRARIIAFNLNVLRNHYGIQNLNSISMKNFKQYAKAIKVGPEIKAGHGQMLTYANGRLYLLADNLKNFKSSNKMLEIDPNTLGVTRISDFSADNFYSARYFHYAEMADSNTMYALSSNDSHGFTEVWKITRNGAGSGWTSRCIGLLRHKLLIPSGPVQGMAINQNGHKIYLATNDQTATISIPTGGASQMKGFKNNSRVLNHSDYNTHRETEGLAYDNGTLYQQMNLRGEFLTTHDLH